MWQLRTKSTFFHLFVSYFFKMLVQQPVQGIDLELVQGFHLSSLLIEIKLNIYKNYPLCDDDGPADDKLLGSKSADFIFHHQSISNSTTTVSAEFSSTVRQVNLNKKNKDKDLIVISLIFPIKRLDSRREFRQKIVSKHHQHCPIFVHDVVSKFDNGSLKLELAPEGFEDEDSSFLQGWTKPSFYIFFIANNINISQPKNHLKGGEEGESGLKHFYDFVETKYFKTIWNYAILIQAGSGEKKEEWKILHVDKNYEIKFRSISRIETLGSSSFSSATTSMSIFGDVGNKLRVNWNGNDLTVLVCAVCGGALGRFHKRGWWDDAFIALVYELSVGANATLVLENVFDMLTDNPDPETGRWGEFIQPLVDGTTPVSGPYKPSLLNRKITLQSSSLGLDSVGFYVALPAQKALTSLWTLLQPMDFNVWLGMALAIIFIFIILWLLISTIVLRQRATTGKMGKKPENFILFASLVGILLDQSGYSSKLLDWFEATPTLNPNTNPDSGRIHRMARLNMGLWFLGLIVISSLYKSRFITLVTLPQYESIPTNFPSLVQTDYEYGAVLWPDLIKQHFSALKNNSVAQVLLERVQEFSYVDSECYRSIFTGKKVCIGLKRIMEMLGLQYLVDIHGQKLAILSSDSYFPTPGTMGVSKQFPEILDLLDFVIQSCESTGITDVWMKNKIARQIWKGKNNAKMYVENSLGPGKDLNGVYFGQSPVDSTGKQITWLSCKLLAFGTSTSIILFFSEIITFKIFAKESL